MNQSGLCMVAINRHNMFDLRGVMSRVSCAGCAEIQLCLRRCLNDEIGFTLLAASNVACDDTFFAHPVLFAQNSSPLELG